MDSNAVVSLIDIEEVSTICHDLTMHWLYISDKEYEDEEALLEEYLSSRQKFKTAIERYWPHRHNSQ